MLEEARSAQEKALHINLDADKFGTFAEIGAGQEVARWFFHVGKASATVAKSISAYDMSISDGLYGKTPHYVSRARLQAMLDHEFRELTGLLNPTRGQRNAFFVFGDTIATHGSTRKSGGHGWMGIRFQDRPGAEPSEVIIHFELLDTFTTMRQEAAGLVGVNLVYGAFALHHDPNRLVRSLMDGLDRRRIEIDMIKFSGPVFTGVDNRLMALALVEHCLADVAMFTASGEVVQPSEVLHARPVLIERGSFRPVTNVTMAMLEASLGQLRKDCRPDEDPVVLLEITVNNLITGKVIDHRDFLARADVLGALQKTVLISNYTRFDLVTTYLRQYTQNRIGMVVGIPTLRAIFDERYYEDLEGGILEGLGRLFRGQVKLFAYPTVSANGELETADKIDIGHTLQHLYAHLFDNGYIVPVREFDTAQLHITPAAVLKMIQAGNPQWEKYVPPAAAAIIREKGLFAP